MCLVTFNGILKKSVTYITLSRRWKAKVKSLERDLDRQKHGTGQMLARHEQLVKEVEGHKQHGNYNQMAMEALKRELADALVSN